MENRLIVLIDFSVYSRALAELAARWCKISQAKLLFVHQVPGFFPALTDDASKMKIIRHEKDQALEKLKKFVEDKNLDPTQVGYVITESHLLNTIDDLLKEGFDDIILVGIRGAGVLKKLLIGNTATTIIDNVKRTVVAVPDKLCAEPNVFCNLVPKRLVVSLSYQFPLNEDAFDNFVNRYSKAITQLEFISAVSDDKEEDAICYLETLTTKYSAIGKSSFRIFKGDNHFEQIRNFVESEPDTILVVQKGSRNLTDLLFRKFMINEIVHDGSLPLVVLP